MGDSDLWYFSEKAGQAIRKKAEAESEKSFKTGKPGRTDREGANTNSGNPGKSGSRRKSRKKDICPVPARQKPEKEEEKLCLWEKGERFLGKIFRFVSGAGKTIWKILRGIVLFPVKVCRRIEKICFTIDGICAKIEKWKKFARDPHTREAWSLVKGSLGRILHHVLPRKIKGKILFGFSDPSATGQFLAAISPFYPLYGRQLSLIPAFDREVLEGEIRFSGRIYGIFFVKTALKIWMDKNIKITIKRFRRMGNA